MNETTGQKLEVQRTDPRSLTPEKFDSPMRSIDHTARGRVSCGSPVVVCVGVRRLPLGWHRYVVERTVIAQRSVEVAFEIERDPERFDGVGFQSDEDRESADQHPSTDVYPDVRVVGGERVGFVVRCEPVANSRQIKQQEVCDRRGSVGTTVTWQEQIQAVEELFGETNLTVRHSGGAVDRARRQ